MATINRDIEIGEDVLDVAFTGWSRWENDSFSYEYGSISATRQLGSYATMEGGEITWPKGRYTEEQNRLIEQHLDQHYEAIESAICEKYSEPAY